LAFARTVGKGLEDFRAARVRSEVELRRRYSPPGPRLWRTAEWRRIAAVALVVGGAILILVALLRGHREGPRAADWRRIAVAGLNSSFIITADSAR
jgi:hypothetical protein